MPVRTAAAILAKRNTHFSWSEINALHATFRAGRRSGLSQEAGIVRNFQKFPVVFPALRECAVSAEIGRGRPRGYAEINPLTRS
jgi:hypothetical protein